MRTTILGLLATALLAALLGCGTSNVGTGVIPSRDVAAFKLNVLDDSFVGGASAQGFDLTVEDYGQDVMVSIKANAAVNLKALYASLEYDPARYTPLTAGPARSLPGTENYISMDYLKDSGRMWYGQVLTNYEWRAGFSGSGTLATAVFRKGAAPARAVSTPPNSPSSATLLTWDGALGLDWLYFNTGDYDQNQEVGIADLTPLGARFGETYNAADKSTGLSAIDGDGNGELNISDLTPIGANFGKLCSGGYNVYSGAVAGDYPAGGTLAGNIAFSSATGGFGGGATAGTRKAFHYDEGGTLAEFYWVKPSDGTTDGTPSNLCTTNPANAPELILTNPPATGSGTAIDPYVIDATTDYVFQINDVPGGSDVTSSADLPWTMPNDEGAGSDNVFNLVDSFSGGDFGIIGSYGGQPALPTIFFRFTTGGGGLVILPDPADTDWSGVTGAGTSADPYICGTGSFNTDTTTVFSLIAQDGVGDPFPGTPSFASNPPFTAIFTVATTPDFVVTMFSNGYAFANDATEGDSNSLYIVYSDLPN